MFASQWIYTACGKTKNGDFSVWSKSADITDNESHEISRTMSYLKPVELPSSPAGDELNLFPKKTCYFVLSTGRCCIAQATYIGQVYSDLDNRTGNYIVHAFVFENNNEILPMTYVGSDIFRTSLTYEEWHDNDAPDELPLFDLSNGNSALTKTEIESFFDETHSKWLELLLQGIINSANTEEKITFYDVDENLKYWYKAISHCLPKFLQRKMTFCSYYTPTFTPATQVAAPGALQADIKIRNVYPKVRSSVFSYAQEVQNKKNAFDFQNNIVNQEIIVTSFVRTIVALFKENLFSALTMVEAVEEIVNRCNCTLDEACDIINLQKFKFECFSEISELNRVLELAYNISPDSTSAIADNLFDYCITAEHFTYSSELLDVYRYIYKNSLKRDKTIIIEKYLFNHSSFGVNDNNDCYGFAKEITDKAPFPWESFVDFVLINENFAKCCNLCPNKFNSQYLVYASLVSNIKTFSDEQKEVATKYFLNLTINSIKICNIEQFKALFSCIGRLGEKWQVWLMKNSLTLLSKESFEIDIAFLLKCTAEMSNFDAELVTIGYLIEKKATALVHTFILSEDKERFAKYEAALNQDECYQPFFDEVETVRFSRLEKVTKSDLQYFYDKFYKCNKDSTGLFKNKLIEYLSTYSNQEIIKESQAAYLTWFKELSDEHSDLIECLLRISDTVLTLDLKLLTKYFEDKKLEFLGEIVKRMLDNGQTINEKYYVLCLGMYTAAIRGKHNETIKAEIAKRLSENSFYDSLSSPIAVNLFVESFLLDVVKLYLEISVLEKPELYFDSCFEKLYTSTNFADKFIITINKLDKKEYARFIVAVFSYAFNQNTSLSKALRNITNEYLDTIGKGQRKKVFALITDNALPQYQKNIANFIEKYQKDHATFLDKILSGISKKKDNKKHK